MQENIKYQKMAKIQYVDGFKISKFERDNAAKKRIIDALSNTNLKNQNVVNKLNLTL
jgi:hypothetical protein